MAGGRAGQRASGVEQAARRSGGGGGRRRGAAAARGAGGAQERRRRLQAATACRSGRAVAGGGGGGAQEGRDGGCRQRRGPLWRRVHGRDGEGRVRVGLGRSNGCRLLHESQTVEGVGEKNLAEDI